jgi:glycosyltransferase involved in cell wall biosynthesis
MKILLLSRYGSLGASSRMRSYQYLPYLESQGIDIKVAPLLNDEYVNGLYSGKAKPVLSILISYLKRFGIVLHSRSFDLLWVESELFPWMPALMEIILNRLSIPYVIDYDDAIFHRYDLHPNRIARFLLGGKIRSAMRNAMVVVAGSMYLADYAVRAGARRVEHIPTVVDLERYHIKEGTNAPGLNVGWIGTPMTVKYLTIVRPAMTQFLKKGDSMLSLIGAGHVNFGDLPVKIIPWSEDTEVAEVQNLDVGIMPLSDAPWEQGKCGYKLIQYMACEKPVIASPVGANIEIVENGVNGFLAGSTEEWLTALNILRDNPCLRKKMGMAGRKKVEEKYCLQVTAPKLMSVFKNTIEKENGRSFNNTGRIRSCQETG